MGRLMWKAPHTMGGFEIVEHTADVGIRAWGATAEECLEQASLGLVAIAGIWGPDRTGNALSIEASARDRPAVLVEWLNEVLYSYEAHDSLVTGIRVEEVTETTARGSVSLVPRGDAVTEGTQVKAVTYHRLHMAATDDQWDALVYVDV